MNVFKDIYQKLRFEDMQEKPTRFASCARAGFLVGSVAWFLKVNSLISDNKKLYLENVKRL